MVEDEKLDVQFSSSFFGPWFTKLHYFSKVKAEKAGEKIWSDDRFTAFESAAPAILDAVASDLSADSHREPIP